MKKIIIDLDNTLTKHSSSVSYKDKEVNKDVVNRLLEYKKEGFEIAIYTSRNMKTYEGRIGKINVHTLPGIVEWLNEHSIPYDEVYVGKPWCGEEGFYVDDRALRPSEFARYSPEEVSKILDREK